MLLHPTPLTPEPPAESDATAPASLATAVASTHAPLIDRFGRHLSYLRVAVNEVCNLRCTYCMPAEGLPFRTGQEILSRDEIVRLVVVAVSVGMTRVRFTGGEPLLRRDLPELVAAAATTPGIESVHLTTNGLLLARHAATLRAAGLGAVNVSLDTLDAARYLQIARRPALRSVLDGLQAALAAGFRQVKVNIVALRGFNDDEIGDFVELTREAPLGVRFIELMPFDSHQIWKTGRFLSAAAICQRLRELHPDIRPVGGSPTEQHNFAVPGYAGSVGVIPAYTRSFCGQCNRLRITADGKVRNCLFSDDEFDLLGPLRDGSTDDDLRGCLRAAVAAKPRDGREAQRNTREHTDHSRDSMTRIGG